MNTDKKEEQVEYTGTIPMCPYCKKPTKRSGSSYSTCTALCYPPAYDENGVNMNPDRNTTTTEYYCEECGRKYSVSGNYTDGFVYIEDNL